uniref:ABC transmembrane type-1 domain-containing protein n=1 Tax=Panagrolaimus sp. JU765 TaxID=591449 RepID=A0AC34RMH0_9BILA
MKVIKLYAWEEPMLKVISEIRQKEVGLIRKASVIRTCTDVINVVSPFLVAITSFILYLYSSPNHVMTPQVAFVSLTLFSQLRHPLMLISELIGLTVQTMISNKRLKEFLVQEELNPDAIQRELSPNYSNAVEIQNGIFTWETNSPPVLKNIDLSIEKGSLVAIVGKVGSGKSSLMGAILGEMEKLQGYVGLRGRCAFSSQQAWIQH